MEQRSLSMTARSRSTSFRVPTRSWIFEAGPFRVNVHGTSFTVAWNPGEAVFEVRLLRGAISVVSPVAEPEIQMRAGQIAQGQLARSDRHHGNDEPRRCAGDRQRGRRGSAHANPARSAVGAGRAGALVASRLDDGARRRTGSADILADADRRGPTAVLERADSDDLWALANAARYAGRYPLAEQALSAHRRRFPSSDRSREAAFLLGRLHERDR